jgi:hypothetical protein
MDETSARKGQDYVTTFMDLDARRVLFATEVTAQRLPRSRRT